MKKIKKIFILILIILYFLITTSVADTGKVNTQAVRIRKSADINSNILTNIYLNDEVEILENNGEWCKVRYNNTEGYVKTEFLEIEGDSNTSNNSNTAVITQENQTETNNENIQDQNNVNQVTQDNVNETSNTIQDNTSQTQYVLTAQANMRTMPNITSNIAVVLEQGKQVTTIVEFNNWIKVTDGSNIGWVPKVKLLAQEQVSSTNEVPNNAEEGDTQENVTEETNQVEEENNINKQGIVTVETANVRESASTSATIIGFLDYNDTVTITKEEGDWYYVEGEEISGYVSKNLISTNVSSRSLTEERKNDNDTTVIDQDINNNLTEALSTQNTQKGNQIAEYAKQFLGCSYVSGGKTPSSGFDCSGFTKYVYSNFGYTLGNTAATQNNLGKDVNIEDIAIGDLILFYDEGKNKIGHTGIYIGDGNFVHAANASRGVVTDNLNTNSYYNTRIVSIKRIAE